MASAALMVATTYGQTAAIADRFMATATARGHTVVRCDLAADPGVPAADVIVLASAVYSNEHHVALQRWLRTHVDALGGRDVRLISVSLAAAIATDEGEGMCWDYVSELTESTGFEPGQVAFLPGALAESRYDVPTRALLRVASWRAPLGLSGDVVLTRDADIDALVERWLG